MNVICFRHPDYSGTKSPELSCKTCCGIFLAELKRQTDAKDGTQADGELWAEEADHQASESATSAPGKFGFDPQSI